MKLLRPKNICAFGFHLSLEKPASVKNFIGSSEIPVQFLIRAVTVDALINVLMR